jgi:hypothetical protein
MHTATNEARDWGVKFMLADWLPYLQRLSLKFASAISTQGNVTNVKGAVVVCVISMFWCGRVLNLWYISCPSLVANDS